MDKLKRLKNEKGQGMVEFALVLPIFLFVCLGIIDFSWIMHQYITFNHAARQAEWNVQINNSGDTENVEGDDAASLISQKMTEDSPTLRANNLTVSSSSASVNIRTQNQAFLLPAADDKGGTIKRVRKVKLIRVKADLSYKVPLLTPVAKTLFGGSFTLNKSIDKERILTFQDKPDTTT